MAVRILRNDDRPRPPTKPGDLWILGRHRLICGDSTDPHVIARLMDGEVADLVVSDPPYGVAYRGVGTRRLPIRNDRLTGAKLQHFLTVAFRHLPLKPGGAFYVCAPAGVNQTAFRQALVDSGLDLKQALVWVKNHFVLGRSDYQNKHENILYGWKAGAVHYFIPDRRQTTVWEFNKPHRSPFHPTSKPVSLVARAIDNSSRIGEIVFDGFGGGGSVLIACEALNRQCRMVEIDATYCDVVVSRYQEAVSSIAERRGSKRGNTSTSG